MESIKYMVVDDLVEYQEALADKLKPKGSKSYVEKCGQARTALDRIKSEHFDVYIVDLRLHEFKNIGKIIYEGIPLIERLRENAPNSLIIAYSTAIVEGREGDSRLIEMCIDAGADEIYSRTNILTMPSATLIKTIKDLLTSKRNSSASARVLKHDNDVNTMAAIEEVGEQNLRIILSDLLPEMLEDHVKAISAGYSGALVFSVRSSTRGAVKVVANNILKVSRSQYALENEFRRRPLIGSHLETHTPSTSTHVSKRVNDWQGLIFSEITGAELLSAYLTKLKFTNTERLTMKSLVDTFFIHPALTANPLPRGVSIGNEFRLSWKAGASVMKFLTDLSEMREIIPRKDQKRAIEVRKYINDILEGNATLFSGKERLSVQHGDLHADNIFVNDHGSAVIIDFARSDVYPRLFDIAALDIDLSLARLDMGRGRQWNINSVDEWEKWATSYFPFINNFDSVKPILSNNNRVHQMKYILLNSMINDLESVNTEEYSRAILFQLTRYIKFPSISIPKKVLAVRLYCRILKRLRLV